MRIQKAIAIMCLCVLYSRFLFGAEEAQVDIQKIEGRTEATISSIEPREPEPPKEPLKQMLMLPERTIVGTARITSKVMGQVADASVLAVQTAGGFVLSPLVHAIDVKNWRQKSKSTH